MDARIVERPEIPYLNETDSLERGDTIFLSSGDQAVIIRSMGDNWRYLVGILPPEDSEGEYAD